ncbi:aluminum-activated malate transporter 2 [Quercus suber]|uniref:Aluminum-activated malate transporter 2 n=1 Tax=Quercus suber TaxID=58331 RepID=A0AAW0L2F5_QUESU
MEIDSPASHEKASLFSRVRWWFEALPKRLTAEVIETASNTKRLAQDDPRRVTHSIKVGLALSLVSLFYYYQPLYDNFGVSAMWAVMTVVVVFEFSVGATLGKGLNRALATLLAAATSTFVRFFPKIKARYDYGLLIFILTFSLISVSGFRDAEILELAHKRLSTVLIGGSSCVIISILVRPVWAGEDLHNLIALNMEKIANFLEHPSVIEYFKTSENGNSNDDKSFLQGYKSVLNSKSNEESLANFARWEPCHGQFHFRHPWKQYLTIGIRTRECAYRIDALSGHLNSDIQAKPEICSKIQEACTTMSLESSKCLRELACGVRAMTHPSSAKHISKAKIEARKLKLLLKSSLWEQDADLLAVIPSVTVASLLIDIVNCTEKIADSVLELASLAHFKSVDPTVSPEKSQVGQDEPDKPLTVIACPQVVIIVDGSENDNPPGPSTNRHLEM